MVNEKKQNTSPFRVKKVGDKYEYDFVSYDEWEKIMTNEDENCEDDYKMDENYKMIKLKDLISEDVDKDIKKNIDEIGRLDNEIDELQKKLKPLRSRYGDLLDNLLPILNSLGKEQVKTQNYIFKIVRKGYERQSFQYKEGFNRALDKVNSNIRLILKQILDDTKKMVKVAPSIQVSPIEIREISFKNWVKKFARKVLRKIMPKLKSVMMANRDLRKFV
jgi:hypothetical protein